MRFKMSDNFNPYIDECMVPSIDGTQLFTRVMLPCKEKGKKFPAVFHRSPYEPGISASQFTAENIKGPMQDFLAAGYAVVNQHCRGTGLSEGVFRNMMNEREDGLATIDWIKEQAWYEGGIYLYGASYKSFVHSAYIPSRPSEVKGAVLAVMPSNMFYVSYEKTSYKHDLFTLWFTKLYMKNQLNAEEKFEIAKKELHNRPLIELPERVYGHKVPEMTDTFIHNNPEDKFWQSGVGFGDSYETPHVIDIPLLLIGGFYDIHYKGTLDFWERLNPDARKKSAFLLGPWGHNHNTIPEHEQLFPGSRRGHPEVEWFNHIRHGTPLVNLCEGKITYYCAGEGWQKSEKLGSGNGNISTLTLYPAADGKLNLSPSVGNRSYDYDPKNPAHFPGGSNVFQSGNAGLQSQPEPDFRPDVLSFISEPFENDITLDGEIQATLEVSSDCTDTAFFVRADIIRDGVTWYMRDTIVNLRDTLGSYTSNGRVRIDLTLDPVAYKIQSGDRIRFDISSSDFPTYNAHSNTSVYWCYAKRTRVAKNTVFMDNSKFSLTIR